MMKVTDEQFDDKLKEILAEMTGAQLLSIPGIYEVVSEHFNNEVLERLENEQDATKQRVFSYVEKKAYNDIRRAEMRNEIEMRLEDYTPNEDVLHGVKAAALQTDEFLDYAAEQLEAYVDNIEGDEVWHVIDDCIRMCGLGPKDDHDA